MAWHLFPRHDLFMRMLLRRQLMGHVTYLMFLIPMLLALQWGWMRVGGRTVAGMFVLAEALNVGYFLLIRSGVTRRLRDPGLLQAQIYTALVMALLVVHVTGRARGITLSLFVALQFFSLFGLTRRQFIVLAVAIVTSYCALVGLEFRIRPPNVTALREELLRAATLTMITVWMALVGSYVAGMRRTLGERKAELKMAMERLREAAERDELTGLHNRRRLMELLAQEQARAERAGAPFSVALVDLDHFKQVNDRHGHRAGDELLRGFGTRVGEGIRELDRLGLLAGAASIGRYGGEEFLLVMPHTGLDGARACVERVRAAVAARPFDTSAGPLDAGFSAGVAQYRPGETLATLLHRADTALYGAKASGRSRTWLATAD